MGFPYSCHVHSNSNVLGTFWHARFSFFPNSERSIVNSHGNTPCLGSRWTQTATQMNGYLGSVQILPDQIQLLNSLMILLFLPIFQKLIYPAFEWCGVTVSPLRKMSLGQVSHIEALHTFDRCLWHLWLVCSNINSKLIAAASFVISGFVQFAIQEGLTPIPDYNSENTLMVTNGVSRDIKVSSSYWINNKLPGDDYENNISIAQAGFQNESSLAQKKVNFIGQDDHWISINLKTLLSTAVKQHVVLMWIQLIQGHQRSTGSMNIMNMEIMNWK